MSRNTVAFIPLRSYLNQYELVILVRLADIWAAYGIDKTQYHWGRHWNGPCFLSRFLESILKIYVSKMLLMQGFHVVRSIVLRQSRRDIIIGRSSPATIVSPSRAVRFMERFYPNGLWSAAITWSMCVANMCFTGYFQHVVWEMLLQCGSWTVFLTWSIGWRHNVICGSVVITWCKERY
jgi:hypothetical protein